MIISPADMGYQFSSLKTENMKTNILVLGRPPSNSVTMQLPALASLCPSTNVLLRASNWGVRRTKWLFLKAVLN